MAYRRLLNVHSLPFQGDQPSLITTRPRQLFSSRGLTESKGTATLNQRIQTELTSCLNW